MTAEFSLLQLLLVAGGSLLTGLMLTLSWVFSVEEDANEAEAPREIGKSISVRRELQLTKADAVTRSAEFVRMTNSFICLCGRPDCTEQTGPSLEEGFYDVELTVLFKKKEGSA